jgi:capsular polysaccharide biosynthesis protein
MLNRRGRGEKLELFDRRNHKSFPDLVRYLGSVKAIIGPHGAALYNARFAPAGTIVYEIVPATGNDIPFMFWEQSRLLEQNYLAYMSDETVGANDVVVRRLKEFVALLESQVNARPAPTEFLRSTYDWDVSGQ